MSKKIETTSKTQSQGENCLFVLKDKNKPGLYEHLKRFNPYYNGTGWFVDKKHESQLQPLCEQIDVSCHEWPLDCTYEESRQRNKKIFLETKLAETNLRITALRHDLRVPITDIEFEEFISNNLDYLEKIPKGQELLELLNKQKQLQEQIEWAKQKEKLVKESLPESFESLLQPITEEEIKKEIQNVSPGIRIGYQIGDVDLELPGGAITIIAGPTSHGKTTMLINFALGALQENPNKSVCFFTYEESRASIASLFLNTHIGTEVSKNNRRSIESFFREGSCKYIPKEDQEFFEEKKNGFFDSLMKPGNLLISYSEMMVEELCQAIRYIKKNKENIGAIFIDYMQLLTSHDSGRSIRQEQLKHICLMLKDCAIETGLPIVLGAQFNRQVTCEADLSPTNISEAGDIERIASLILGFWNRNFLGFSREGNKTKQGKTITEPRPEIYVEVLKGRKIGNGHNSVWTLKGNEGKIENNTRKTEQPTQNNSYNRFNDA